MTETNGTPGNGGEQASKKKKGKRGWWWKLPLAAIVLLVVLVLLLPTIASTSPVRGMVLSKVNASLPGKLGVEDWSLGWFSGVNVKGIDWTDASGRKLATVSEVRTSISLMQLAKGNLHLGEIVIPNVNLDLVVPMQKSAAGAEKTKTGGAGEGGTTTFTMPDVAASVKIQSITGQVVLQGDEGRTATIKLDKSTSVALDLPAGGDAKGDVVVAIAQPSGVGSVTVNATVKGLKPGMVDALGLTGGSVIKLQGLDLAGAGDLAKVTGSDVALKGLVEGQIEATIARPGEATVNGQIAAANVAAKVGADEFATSKVVLPIDVAIAEGLTAPRVKINQLGVSLDQGSVSVAGEVPVASLQFLAAGLPVTEEGAVSVKADLPNLPVVLNSLRNAVKLQKGVQVTGGALAAGVDLAITKQGLKVHAPVTLKGLEGVRDGKKIGPFQPLTLDAGAVLPSLKNPQDVRNIDVQVTSSFMTVSAKGPTLGQAVVNVLVDAGKLNADLGQLVDLSMIRSGRLTVNVVNRSTSADVIEPDAQIQVSNLGLDLPAQAGQPARRIENGSLLISARTRYAGDVAELVQPARVELSGRILELAAGKSPRVILDQPLQVLVDGSADLKQKPGVVTLKQFVTTVGGEQPVLRMAMAQDKPTQLTLSGARGVTGAVALDVQADLVAAMALAQHATAATQPAVPALRGGMFHGVLNTSIAANGDLTASLAATTDLTATASSGEIRDRIETNVDALVPADMSSVNVGASVKGSAFELSVPQTQVVLSRNGQAVGPLEMAPNAKLKLTVSDIARATQLAGAFAPVPAMAGGPVNLEVTASRQQSTTELAVAAESGELRFAEAGRKPVMPAKLALHAAVDTDPTQKQLLQQLKLVKVDQLDVQTEVAKVSLPQPIVISDVAALLDSFRGKDLPANAKVEGQLRVTANLGKVMALAGPAKADAFVLDGDVTAEPKLSLQGRDVVAEVNSVIENLKVTQGDKLVVQESKLSLGGGVRLQTQQKAVQLQNVGITSADGLLSVKATGSLSELGTQNKLQDVKLEWTPDLAKIWTIIHATLPPEKQAKIGELVLAGKRANTLVASGSYPLDKPYGEAIKQLSASGDFGFDSIDYKQYGVTLGKGVIPFTLDKGVVRLMAATDKGLQAAEPIACNQGKLDLSEISVDIAAPVMRLDIPAGKQLVQKVQLNTVMVASLGKYANPLFMDPQNASGQVDLAVVRCTQLPLGEAMYDPADPGYAEFSISVANLDLAGKGIDKFLAILKFTPDKGQSRVVGTIKDARVIIAQGKCIQRAGLQLGDQTLTFNGEMTLVDNRFSNLQVDAPSTMISRVMPSAGLEKYLPPQVSLSFSGPANALKLNPDCLTNLVADAGKKQVQDRLLGGKSGQKGNDAAGAVGGLLQGVLGGQSQQPSPAAPAGTPAPQSTPQAAPASQPADVVGGLIDMFGKKKDKKKK